MGRTRGRAGRGLGATRAGARRPAGASRSAPRGSGAAPALARRPTPSTPPAPGAVRRPVVWTRRRELEGTEDLRKVALGCSSPFSPLGSLYDGPR
ncbi:hypothetical protein VULLAG_LOCUS14249 [Vulpes lagopus]